MIRPAVHLVVLLFLTVIAAPVQAQRVVASALDQARVTSAAAADTGAIAPSSPKSPGIAGVASVFLPGSGHIYAGEGGRGLAVMAIYFVAVPFVMSGRTDGLGKVAGVIAIGSYFFGIIDSVNAAHRYNARIASAAK